jgi:hypothetical protein
MRIPRITRISPGSQDTWKYPRYWKTAKLLRPSQDTWKQTGYLEVAKTPGNREITFDSQDTWDQLRDLTLPGSQEKRRKTELARILGNSQDSEYSLDI